MFTATQDLILPTTVTGSWPRPRWFTMSMAGRPPGTALMDVTYREQFTDALSSVVVDQQRAGLDIVTNGDYFLDEDFAGRSWHHYALQRWRGLEGDYDTSRARWEQLDFPAGTLLHEIYTTWRWPRVVGKVERNPDNPLQYDKIWRLTQARANKPVKFGVCSAQVYSFFLEVLTDAYRSDDKRQLIWDMATAVNADLRDLAAAGCKVIQIEDPIIHYAAHFDAGDEEYLDFLVDAFNHEVEGLDDVEIWIHTCWGNPNMQRVYAETPYVPRAIEVYLERARGDVLTVEMKDRSQADIEVFAPYKGRMKKKVAIGVVSHRSLQVETPDEVAQQVRDTMRYIDPEQLVLSSDCGFGRQGCNRVIAFYKAAAIAQGANIVRRELGASETYVPAADPALQMDVLLA